MPQDVTPTLDLVYLPDGRVVNETDQDPAIERITGHQHYWVAAARSPRHWTPKHAKHFVAALKSKPMNSRKPTTR